MKVGLYFDLRNPHAWRQDPARLHSFTLEAIEEAEHLGADSIWLSEHHLFADDYVAAPLTFLAAAAARTSRVRLGSAVVLAPLHHAVEIAEQAAMVDLISGGRLELGLGTGYRVSEYEWGRPPPPLRADRREGRRDTPAVVIRWRAATTRADPASDLDGLSGAEGGAACRAAWRGVALRRRPQLAVLPRRAAGRWPLPGPGADGRLDQHVGHRRPRG